MAASQLAIFVANGADRPGVLDDISMFLAERHVKILESRVSLLRGQFALLLLVGADAASLNALRQSMPELEKQVQIDVALRPAGESGTHDVTPMLLRAEGKDPATVVHRLSHLMRVLGTNISNIETDTTGAPASDNSGEDEQTSFTLEMELAVPRHTPVVMLKQYVDSLAEELGIRCEVNVM
jgi:glycine cleavage system transcriptional repressor